jgi:hypothetical protein
MTEKRALPNYPWLHLAPQIVGTDLPADVETLINEKEAKEKAIELKESVIQAQTATIETLSEELTTKQRIIEAHEQAIQAHEQRMEAREKELRDLKDLLESTKNKYTEKYSELQQLSKKTFETLENQLDSCCYDELIYPILVQTIISQKLGLIGAARHQRTIHGVIRWLQQRANVILYLRNRGLMTERANKLEKVCFIDEAKLMQMIEQLRF